MVRTASSSSRWRSVVPAMGVERPIQAVPTPIVVTWAPDPSRLRVFMSSATDPYQPAEARLRITRGLLDVFGRRPIGRLVVQTRSPLVERDLDLLASMPFAWLSMTVETDDDRVRRAL